MAPEHRRLTRLLDAGIGVKTCSSPRPACFRRTPMIQPFADDPSHGPRLGGLARNEAIAWFRRRIAAAESVNRAPARPRHRLPRMG
jgi:hypothetical protein